MWKNIIVLVAILALFVCCRGERSASAYAYSHQAELVAQTKNLWKRYGRVPDDIPPADVPPVVEPLNPIRVYATEQGVFIETHTRFVERAGIFIRHDLTYTPPQKGDPGFRPIASNIYWYYAPG